MEVWQLKDLAGDFSDLWQIKELVVIGDFRHGDGQAGVGPVAGGSEGLRGGDA